MAKLTPLMRQYYEIKNKYPDTILLFQVGDFYELFFDDAKVASETLGITLTQRGTDANGNPIPLAGVPVHVLDHYVTKLVKNGFKVAVCDQLTQAIPGKVIERGIAQVLTPGTLTDIKLLDDKSASYLAIVLPTSNSCTLIFAEILTGQIFTTLINLSGGVNLSKNLIESELSRFLPDEIVLPDNKLSNNYEQSFKALGYVVSRFKFNFTDLDLSNLNSWLESKFSQNTINTINSSQNLKSSLYLLYSYLNHNNPTALEYFKQFYIYNTEDFLMLDSATSQNLELIKNAQDGTSKGALFSVIDKAVTSMGSRTLKKWLQRPLVKLERIIERQEVVACLIDNIDLKQELIVVLKNIGDIERIVGRIALNRAQLYDYINLKKSIKLVPEILKLLSKYKHIRLIEKIYSQIIDFEDLYNFLDRALNEDSSNTLIIATGFDQELDRLRSLVDHGSAEILKLESQEQEKTGINSLKIRYHQVHGYTIEITKTNVKLVPERFIKIQTLAQKSRYTTQELKDLEYDILRARNEVSDLEKNLFEAVKLRVLNYLTNLKKLSQALCHTDGLLSLACLAYDNNYTCPEFNNNQDIVIKDGRHPVIESRLKDSFIPNDTLLNQEHCLWVITGPNMGGKSTYLRQVALISILAQMGSFVPASYANLPVLDRIFTRLGAADNVSEGKSTFLVEMEETAMICNMATNKSLVILDEVGRGTSTFDGFAIAQAVLEYIYTNIKARCLFATHYHQLTELSKEYPGITAYYAASEQTSNGIVLLHKIKKGVADGSFGLEVAKLANLPKQLIIRSEEILNKLKAQEELNSLKNPNVIEAEYIDLKNSLIKSEQKIKSLELELSNLNNKENNTQDKSSNIIAAQLSSIDCDNITPREALDILVKLKQNY